MNLSELWKLYEADKRIQGFSPHTLKAYALQLRILIGELGDLNIGEVTLQLLKEYLAKQSGRLKPSSLGHRIRFVRSLFRLAYEEGYLTTNPSLKLREPKMDKRIPKFLIEEDVIHLKISCLYPRERALLEFLYSTGCRVGEVQKINIEDLNWENCSAVVNGKGSKQREIYFTTECKVWLKKYLASREDLCKALFVTDTYPTRRMAIPTIRWALKKLADRGAIEANVYPHRFRHTYACSYWITEHRWSLYKACWATRKHRPHKYMPNCVASADESYIAGSFSTSSTHQEPVNTPNWSVIGTELTGRIVPICGIMNRNSLEGKKLKSRVIEG